jgi:hypothetical protein
VYHGQLQSRRVKSNWRRAQAWILHNRSLSTDWCSVKINRFVQLIYLLWLRASEAELV